MIRTKLSQNGYWNQILLVAILFFMLTMFVYIEPSITSKVIESGVWILISDFNYTDGSALFSNTPNSSLIYNMSGNVGVIYQTRDDFGMMDVYADSVLIDTIDMYSQEVKYNVQKIYNVVYELKLVVSGNQNKKSNGNYVVVDNVLIDVERALIDLNEANDSVVIVSPSITSSSKEENEIIIKSSSGQRLNLKIKDIKKKINKNYITQPDSNLTEGVYSLSVEPERTIVEKIEFYDILISNRSGMIGIDDIPLTKFMEHNFTQIYAIDPTKTNFTNATVTVTAKSTALYKCKDWNFNMQSCEGKWELFKTNLIPGEKYTFTLTPQDPGFAEGDNYGLWKYRKEILVAENSGINLEEYQIKVEINTNSLIAEGKVNSDCSDLRFANASNNDIPYYIDEGPGLTCNTTETLLWVQVPVMTASSNTTIYMYYGNVNATSESNISSVFTYKIAKAIYYTVGENVYDGNIRVVAYDKNTNIIAPGKTISLNAGKFTNFSTAEYGGTGASRLNVTGALIGGDADEATGAELNPISWAGTEFVVDNGRGAYDLYFYAPFASITINCYEAVNNSGTWGTSQDSASCTKNAACSATTKVWTSGNSIYCNATAPFLMFVESTTNANFPVYPLSNDIWGVAHVRTANAVNNAWIQELSSAGDNRSGTRSIGYTSYSADGADGSGLAYHITSNATSLGANEHGDGDGNENAALLPEIELEKQYYFYKNGDYVALSATGKNTNCTLYSGRQYYINRSDLSGEANDYPWPSKIDLGTGADVQTFAAGAKVECTSPAGGNWETTTDDESVLFGRKSARQYMWPEPSYVILEEENQPPAITNVLLNATSANNLTSDNLTLYFTATDINGNTIKNITNWLINGSSIAILNMPFEAGGNTTHNENYFTRDYSTGLHNGTVNGTTWNSSGGYSGFGAYDFDGVSSYIDAGDIDDIDTSAELSGCAWVYHDTSSNDDTIFKKSASQTDGIIFYRQNFQTATGKSDVYGIFVADSADTSSALLTSDNLSSPLEKWTYVCFTYLEGSSTGLRLYVNGIEAPDSPVSVSGITAHDAGSEPFLIGANWTTSTQSFDGRIDEVIVWNRTLSSAQIQALYNNRTDLIVSQETSRGDIWSVEVTPNDGTQDGTTVTSNLIRIENSAPVASNVNITPATVTSITSEVGGTWTYTDADGDPENATVYEWYINGTRALSNGLVGYWDFDTNGYDKSGTGNNGVVVDVTNISGKIKNAFEFNRTGGSPAVTITDHASIEPTQEISISMWFKPNQISKQFTLMSKSSFNNRFIILNTNSIIYYQSNGTSLFTDTATGLVVSNKWQHVAGTYDGENIKIYYNGEFKNATPATGPMSLNNADLVIGAYSLSQEGFNGSIDEVKIWNRSLTAQEISDLYNMTFYGQIDQSGANHTLTNLTSNYYGVGTNLTFGVTPFDSEEYGEQVNSSVKSVS